MKNALRALLALVAALVLSAGTVPAVAAPKDGKKATAAKPSAKPGKKAKKAPKIPEMKVRLPEKPQAPLAVRADSTFEPEETKAPITVAVHIPEGATPYQAFRAAIDAAELALQEYHIGTHLLGGDNAVVALRDPTRPDRLVIANILEGTSRTAGIDLEVLLNRRTNSQYAVTPGNLQVLGVLTNAEHGRRVWTRMEKLPQETRVRDKSTGRLKLVHRKVLTKVEYTQVYTEPGIAIPFQEIYRTPELIGTGWGYMTTVVQVAQEVLRMQHVQSIVMPKKSIGDVITKRILLTLAVIEQTDDAEIRKYGAAWALDKYLAYVGLNTDMAFNHVTSRVGARNLAQFMEASYVATVRQHPKAKLIKDFHEGMQDHHNAFKAMACYADRTLDLLPPKLRAELLRPEKEKELGLYIAAAYNGRPSTAVKRFTADRKRWQQSGRGLHPETVGYLVKFHGIWDELAKRGF